MSESEIMKERELLSLERIKFEREKLEFEQKKLQRDHRNFSRSDNRIAPSSRYCIFTKPSANSTDSRKFIPYLQKQDTRDAALLTMSGFVDQQFVTQLAEKLKATTVLEAFQAKGTEQEK